MGSERVYDLPKVTQEGTEIGFEPRPLHQLILSSFLLHFIALGIKSKVISMVSGSPQVLSFFICQCHALAPAPTHTGLLC